MQELSKRQIQRPWHTRNVQKVSSRLLHRFREAGRVQSMHRWNVQFRGWACLYCLPSRTIPELCWRWFLSFLPNTLSVIARQHKLWKKYILHPTNRCNMHNDGCVPDFGWHPALWWRDAALFSECISSRNAYVSIVTVWIILTLRWLSVCCKCCRTELITTW